MWNEIATKEDIVNFMNIFGGFHDSCIKEISYISGAFVGDDLAMMPINNMRTADIVFQRQFRNPMAIVMRFSGLKKLHLAPNGSNYTCEIYDAAMFINENLIYWADNNYATEENIETYDGTWICAEKLQWRVIDECMGEDKIYRATFE